MSGDFDRRKAATRVVGGLIGLALGTATAQIAGSDGSWMWGMAIPTGAFTGVAFAPWIRRGDDLYRVAVRMGAAAVLLGALLVSLEVSAGGGLVFIVGVLFFGLPMLVVTVPVAMTWAVLTRFSLRRLGLAQ